MDEKDILLDFIYYIYLMGNPLPNSKCNVDNWDTSEYQLHRDKEIKAFRQLIDLYIQRED